MLFSDIFGHALSMMPVSAIRAYRYDAKPGSTYAQYAARAYLNHSFTTNGNNFYFFSGEKPSEEELFAIEDEATLLSTYADRLITRKENIDIIWNYDEKTRERSIRKPYDALDMTVELDGDIIWAAVVMTHHRVSGELPIDETKDNIMFTDFIGIWNDEDMVITLEKKIGCVTGETVSFKDFSFMIRDKSKYEEA